MTTLRFMSREQTRLFDLRNSRPIFCAGNRPSAFQPDDDESNPTLVRPIHESYESIFKLMTMADFDPASIDSCTLPPELVKRVLSFLTIKKVRQEEVIVTNCSSHDGIHPLSMCLVDSERSWWLSSPGTMPGGRGKQFVQFMMHQRNKLRRLSSVSIKIPPIPLGPLSVREFFLQAFHIERGWYAITPVFVVKNESNWQKFPFEEVDVDEVRLVCLSNQMEQYLSSLRADNPNDQNLLEQLKRFESVGFFSVKFD